MQSLCAFLENTVSVFIKLPDCASSAVKSSFLSSYHLFINFILIIIFYSSGSCVALFDFVIYLVQFVSVYL